MSKGKIVVAFTEPQVTELILALGSWNIDVYESGDPSRASRLATIDRAEQAIRMARREAELT